MFKWNNIEFRDKGIIVEHTPKIAKPKKGSMYIRLKVEMGSYQLILVHMILSYYQFLVTIIQIM